METLATHAARLALTRPHDLVFGRAPRPVRCGLGPLEIGGGRVYPEVNFTLPEMEITCETWPRVKAQYHQMVTGILQRVCELNVPGLVLEFEHLPPMTEQPAWGEEITALIRGLMAEAHRVHGIPMALRVTIVDLRDAQRPPRLRTGHELEVMLESLRRCARAGADILSIESVGGKEVNDVAMLEADLAGTIAGTAVLGARDMEMLWRHIVAIAEETACVAGGDSACGFANTAMVLADQRRLPAVFAAVVRALGAAQSTVAHDMGAVGPTKDCAYEGPVLKALHGVPVSLEGKSAACAHMSHVGNVAAACADLWSNESVQNVRLLAGQAPTVFAEMLVYDCRLMNEAARRGEAHRLQDWLIASDARLKPGAFILTPACSVALAEAIASTTDHLGRARAVTAAALRLMRGGAGEGHLVIDAREASWLSRLEDQLASVPAGEGALIDQVQAARPGLFTPSEYGL